LTIISKGYLFGKISVYPWQGEQVIAGWQGPSPIWKEAQELGLQGNFALQWNKNLTVIRIIDFCRIENHNFLTWRGKRGRENIRVDETYLNLTRSQHSLLDCLVPYPLGK